MKFLLDINVISEAVRPAPDRAVMRWLHETDEDLLFVSVITVAELRRGVELLPEGRRRTQLSKWIEIDFAERFSERLLPVTPQIAEAWGVLMARAKRDGRSLHALDGFLAATAMTHDLRIVTRNVRDFEPTGVALFNPWPA